MAWQLVWHATRPLERSKALELGNFYVPSSLPPSLIPGHHLPRRFDPGVVARVALGLHSERAFVFTPTKTGLARARARQLFSPRLSWRIFPKEFTGQVICHQSSVICILVLVEIKRKGRRALCGQFLASFGFILQIMTELVSVGV